MKIIIAVHHFPPRYTSGAELRAFHTASELQRRGHDIRVICVEKTIISNKNTVTWQDDVYMGLPVHRLYLTLETNNYPLSWIYRNKSIYEHLLSLLSEWQPDIFHLISGYLLTVSSLQAAQKLNIPNLVTLTDYWFICPRLHLLRSNGKLSTLPINTTRCARCLGEEKRRYRYLGKILPSIMEKYWQFRKGKIQAVEHRLEYLIQSLNQVDKIISPSRFLQDVYVQTGTDLKKILYIRQGRDFPYRTLKLRDRNSSTELLIGYIGQIAEIKGVHILFEAIHNLPDLTLKVKAYGNKSSFPRYTKRLERMIKNDSRLQLAGTFNNSEISRVLHDLDVIVVPSIWYENSPTVILEAFAHKTPVIASNLGGMAELVEHGKNGLLFYPGDPDDLAQQIHRLVDEPELLTKLQSGIQPIKSLEEEIDELESLYHSL